jgi:alpha-tubulin suppressor-like RCC1 family protein
VKLQKAGRLTAAAIALTALAAGVPAPALAAGPAGPSVTAALATAPGSYVPLTPKRVFDSRHGLGLPTAKIAAQGTVSVTVAGAGGVPASNVSAVVLNVTVTDTVSSGFVTVFPGGAVRPSVSNLNFATAQTVANLVTVGVGANGNVSLFNGSSGSVDLLGDVSGYYVGGTVTDPGAFVSLSPKRILDTRKGVGAPVKAVKAGGKLDLTVQGAGGVSPAGAAAVVMNVTATAPTHSGYLTVYPAGAFRPTASNLNFTAGRTVPNLVTVALGTSGHVTIYNGSIGTVHLIADVAGYYVMGTATKPGTFVPTAKPTRVLDTRVATGAPAKAAVLAGHEVGLQTLDGTTVPLTGVSAVTMNVTSTGSTASGYVTVSPTDPAQPTVSTLNHSRGQTIANLAIVPPGLCGKSTFYNGSGGSTHLVADVAGYFLGDTSGGGSGPKTAVSWGNNAQGQLGDGSRKTTKAPGAVMGLDDVRAVSGSGLAVTNAGAVWAWGPAELTQLYGAAASRDQGYRNCGIPQQVPGLSSIKAVAGSPSVGYALDNAGKVWAWGVNTRGQLGNGTTITSFVPQKILALTPGTTKVIAISAGFAVRDDGTVWGWGDNTSGKLGTGATVGIPKLSPVQVAGVSGATALAQQGNTEFALLDDQTVMSWGSNVNSALGNGMVADTDPHPSPVWVAAVHDPAHLLTGVTAIAGGMALLNDQSIVTWGANSSGQLGNSSIGVPTTTPVLIAYPGGTQTFTAIASGGNVDVARSADGTVWAWGEAFGNGGTKHTGTPAQIAGLTGVLGIGAGSSTGFAVVP